jgi:hypothetical protein
MKVCSRNKQKTIHKLEDQGISPKKLKLTCQHTNIDANKTYSHIYQLKCNLNFCVIKSLARITCTGTLPYSTLLYFTFFASFQNEIIGHLVTFK